MARSIEPSAASWAQALEFLSDAALSDPAERPLASASASASASGAEPASMHPARRADFSKEHPGLSEDFDAAASAVARAKSVGAKPPVRTFSKAAPGLVGDLAALLETSAASASEGFGAGASDSDALVLHSDSGKSGQGPAFYCGAVLSEYGADRLGNPLARVASSAGIRIEDPSWARASMASKLASLDRQGQPIPAATAPLATGEASRVLAYAGEAASSPAAKNPALASVAGLCANYGNRLSSLRESAGAFAALGALALAKVPVKALAMDSAVALAAFSSASSASLMRASRSAPSAVDLWAESGAAFLEALSDDARALQAPGSPRAGAFLDAALAKIASGLCRGVSLAPLARTAAADLEAAFGAPAPAALAALAALEASPSASALPVRTPDGAKIKTRPEANPLAAFGALVAAMARRSWGENFRYCSATAAKPGVGLGFGSSRAFDPLGRHDPDFSDEIERRKSAAQGAPTLLLSPDAASARDGSSVGVCDAVARIAQAVSEKSTPAASDPAGAYVSVRCEWIGAGRGAPLAPMRAASAPFQPWLKSSGPVDPGAWKRSGLPRELADAGAAAEERAIELMDAGSASDPGSAKASDEAFLRGALRCALLAHYCSAAAGNPQPFKLQLLWPWSESSAARALASASADALADFASALPGSGTLLGAPVASALAAASAAASAVAALRPGSPSFALAHAGALASDDDYAGFNGKSERAKGGCPSLDAANPESKGSDFYSRFVGALDRISPSAPLNWTPSDLPSDFQPKASPSGPAPEAALSAPPVAAPEPAALASEPPPPKRTVTLTLKRKPA